MSAKAYTSIDKFINYILDSYFESGDIAVIININYVMPVLQKLLTLNSKGTSFLMDVESNDSLFDDLKIAEENKSPFIITIINGKIITEPFKSNYEIKAFEDMLYIIEDEYSDIKNVIKPSHFALFSCEFDPFEIAF